MSKTRRVRPDPISFSSVFIEAWFGSQKIGIASGFPWREEAGVYLVTNWHVVSGIHPETSQPIDKHGTIPDYLRVWLHQKENLGVWERIRIDLYDNQGRPRWLEHSGYGSEVDVALMQIDVPGRCKAFPINERPLDDFRVEVSQDVFVVGFPRGMSGAGKLPIWKRGSIASEPELDLDGVPKLLIDSLTREGMSGSPVIAQYVGYYKVSPPKTSSEDWIGVGRKFLGVYSGRLPGQDEFEAHLGIVWKESVIEEIISSGHRPA